LLQARWYLLEEFKTLLMKMAKDVDNEPTTTNYELLCDIETVMGLT
jgi:hypothetical protein